MPHEPVFCRDGVLRLCEGVWDRRTEEHHHVLLPVTGLERVLERPVFLSLLHRSFELEEGITVRELMNNLSPWASLVSPLSGIDFPAFFAEAHAPEPDGQRVDDVERVDMRWRADVSAVPAYDDPPGVTGLDAILRRIPGSRSYTLVENPPLITDEVILEGGWDAVGVYREPRPAYDGAPPTVEHGSLLGAPLSCWAHLPVTVSRSGEIHDRTPGSPHLTDRGGVLRPVGKPVGRSATTAGQPRMRRLAVPGPTLFDGILIALLRPMGFFGPPAARDQVVSDMHESAAELERQTDEDRAAKDAGPEAVARLEERIRAEEAARRAEEDAAGDVRFDEASLSVLDLARDIERLMPGSVRMPTAVLG